MRILMTLMVFHPVVGGTEISAKELAVELVKRGHQIDVVTLRHAGWPTCERIDGVQVCRLLRGLGRGPLFVLSYMVSLGWFLLRRRKRYDVIQVYYAYLDALTVRLLRRWLRASVVVRLGGGGPAGDLSRLRRLGLERLFLPLIKTLDRFVVMSRQMAQELITAGFDQDRIVLIPNGVDTTYYAPAVDGDETKNRSRTNVTALSVARLSPEKGISVLLEAWWNVTSSVPSARLLLIGDGPQRRELERQAEERGVHGSVRFVGEVSDVRQLFQNGDAFVLPSLSEGMPNALLQAMAVGLPCVATNVGGIPEMIADGANGRLVPAGNPHALAEALLEVLSNRERATQLGLAARHTVETRYRLDRMVSQYLQLYQKLLAV